MGVCSMTGYRNRLLLTASEEPTLKLHLQPSEDALHAARTAKAAGFMVGGVHDWSSDADWPELRRIADWSAETLGEFEI